MGVLNLIFEAVAVEPDLELAMLDAGPYPSRRSAAKRSARTPRSLAFSRSSQGGGDRINSAAAVHKRFAPGGPSL
jgi:hypothetical protein